MAVKINARRLARRFEAMKIFQDFYKSRNGHIFINVTALVDMMTVLVIFLMMQFSSTGEMLFISKNLKMPDAKNGSEIVRAPILSLSRSGELYFEGSMISTHVKAPHENEDWEIPELWKRLKENQQRFETLRAKAAFDKNVDDNLIQTVNVQVDQNVEYRVLKRVLYTCETAGYGKIRLSVTKEIQKQKEI